MQKEGLLPPYWPQLHLEKLLPLSRQWPGISAAPAGPCFPAVSAFIATGLEFVWYLL